ncbi:MAG: formylglycine-generating enzyme family protein [Blastocatellia bacterium]
MEFSLLIYMMQPEPIPKPTGPTGEEGSAENQRAAKNAVESRLIPLAVAILTCILISLSMAYALVWLFPVPRETQARVTATNGPAPAPPPTPAQPAGPTAPPASMAAPLVAADLPVDAGLLAAPGSMEPTRKVRIAPFHIAETEVTNRQYREFTRATGHAPPSFWSNGDFPPGAGDDPVTMVSWQDAADYCRWLSGVLGREARLPSEAEWELAAGGPAAHRYPWGNNWDDKAAASAETSGRMQPVRSYPAGRAPSGAYDMAGNAWEWVRDEAPGPDAPPGTTMRIARGGAANEPMKFIGVRARTALPGDKPRRYLGFRFVIIREGDGPGAPATSPAGQTAPGATPPSSDKQPAPSASGTLSRKNASWPAPSVPEILRQPATNAADNPLR